MNVAQGISVNKLYLSKKLAIGTYALLKFWREKQQENVWAYKIYLCLNILFHFPFGMAIYDHNAKI